MAKSFTTGKRNRTLLRSSAGVLVMAAGFWGPACGSAASDPPSTSIGGSGGSAASGGSGAAGSGGSSASGGSGASTFDAGGGDAAGDAGCAFITEKATATTLNLYVMVDKSNSMQGNLWSIAESGLVAFFEDGDSAGIRVALSFFPRPPDAFAICDQRGYIEPRVDYGELNGHAPQLTNALTGENPDGLSTPTLPALNGALRKSIEVAQTRSGEAAAVLLVTDGNPAGACDNTQSAIEQVAANALAFDPSVTTYVIALPGVDAAFADAVAAAGGTVKALYVTSTNAEAEFEQALAKVRGQALPCEYELPTQVEGGEIAFDRVNVVYVPSSGSNETIPQTDPCDGSRGWRYDDPANPRTIELCPATCDAIKQDFGARLDIQLGCETVVK